MIQVSEILVHPKYQPASSSHPGDNDIGMLMTLGARPEKKRECVRRVKRIKTDTCACPESIALPHTESLFAFCWWCNDITIAISRMFFAPTSIPDCVYNVLHEK